MADICGPFTLDQLDVFGGVNQLAFSLDNPIWQLPDTCVLFSTGSATGIASTVLNALRERTSSGNATGIADTAMQATRVRTSTGSATAIAFASLNGIRVRLSTGSATGVAVVSALGGVEFSAEGSATGRAIVEATAFAIYDSGGSVVGVAFVSADGTVLGEEWVAVPVGNEQWKVRGDGICGPFTLDQLDIFGGVNDLPFSLDNPIYLRSDFCANAEIWNKKSEGSNTWLRKG